MKRLAAFLLLAGIAPIPLFAGDFTARRAFFHSDTPTEATATLPTIPVAQSENPKLTSGKKAAPNSKEYLVKIPDAAAKQTPPKTVVPASGTNAPRTTTSYMKSLFTTDSTSAVWVGQTPTPTQLNGVSVYAMPQQAVTTTPTRKPAAATTLTAPVVAAPLPTRPMIPAPTLTSMSLPPGTVIKPAEMLAQPVTQTMPTRQSAAPMGLNAPATTMPLPTGFKLVGGESPAAAQPTQAPVYDQGTSGSCSTCGVGPRDSRGSFSGRLLSWACFKPTTRNALPCFQPLPYVTPIIAFRCDDASCGAGSYGGGCGSGNCATGNCATGNGGGAGLAGRFGLGDRGRKSGCVSPSDNVFPGYQFATGPAPMAGPHQPQGYTSYKPTTQAAPAPVQTSGGYYKPTYATDSSVKPAGGDVLARPFTRP